MDKMENLLDFVQNMLFFMLKLVIIIMIISQTLLLIPGMGTHFNLALRLEGEPLKEDLNLYQVGQIALTPWTSMTLELEDYQSRPDVIVELNGRDVGTFLKKEFSLAVEQGDLITIFNPQEKYPVRIIISKKTANVLFPPLDSSVYGTGRLYFPAVDLE